MNYYFKQPRYFKNFKCIGGDCPESCCGGWMVEWKLDEMTKLVAANAANCIDKERINSAFVKIDGENKFVIKLCDGGRCPFHNKETGLCDIQKELGEDALGWVCTDYPRRRSANDNIIMRWCSASCIGVVDMIISDKDAVSLEHFKIDKKEFLLTNADYDTDSIIAKHLYVKYRFNITDLFIDLFSNDDCKIEDSVILGAIAAKHLSDAAENAHVDILDKIESLRIQLKDPAVIKSLQDIKPNYKLKFKLVNNMIVEIFDSDYRIIDLSQMHDGNELITERYFEGMKKFYKAFEDKPYALRNVIINTFYDLKAPMGNLERSIFENYSYFVICAAVIETAAAAVGFSSENIEYDFKKCVSKISRGLTHSTIKANAVMDNMRENGINSPAHLALIIK